ncbi:hypothetical protein CTI12_AA530440 [Artemisia annua]|uniref:beta-ketoacyl-[acyl-carrier-protein] synthase I n=1 Tax=Artemisia annua TaxID=35608 RepID=A0A2U1KW67_ARTAN|nr:hypothetical protein CTI12_AA530440 [Artemisia annua]
MGVVSVFGNDVDKYYNKLLAGENGITLIDKFNASNIPVRFGGKKALEDAALGILKCSKHINKECAGVLVGSGLGCMSRFSDSVESLNKTRDFRKCKHYFAHHFLINSSPALLAIHLGFMGPNYSSQLLVPHQTIAFVLHRLIGLHPTFCAAANHIREGEAYLMIAGGVEAPFLSFGVVGLAATTATSTRNDNPRTASRPWDKDRDGFVIGEGAGVLVMESLEHAMKRDAPIIAEYLGGAVNCDAYHITNPRPDGFGVSSCIQRSLINAGVSVEEITWGVRASLSQFSPQYALSFEHILRPTLV